MKISRILFILIVLMSLSGCDFFRKVAGRSTSADIEAKKAVIAMQERQKEVLPEVLPEVDVVDTIVPDHDVIIDSIALEQAKADSLAAIATLSELKIRMYKYSKYKGASSDELPYRYYIMVGAFEDAANAAKHMAKIQKTPAMDPVSIKFRNGLTAVGVCPRNKLSDIALVAESVFLQAFCPMDAWVLVNE